MTIDISKLYRWKRESVVRFFFFLGMAIAFLGSLNPWFMWPLGIYYIIVSSMCLVAAMALARPLSERFFDRYDFILPIFACAILVFYQSLIRSKDLNSYIANVFHLVIFYTLFRVRVGEVRRFCNLLSKLMGGFLIVSMFFFLLYLLGFPLPSRNANFLTAYSYFNYFFFLIDDRFVFSIIPRFHSVFLEPGHMGTMTVMLLFTQIGKWKKWYNVSLLVATIISFSLAAYGLLVGVVFLGLWIRGKQFLRKTIYAIAVFAAVTVGAFYYNNGDNLLHDLILIRLEISDGEMAGDNRVSDDFKADYESLMQSADALTGRDRNTESTGNSGYRVFIYDYGLIGLLLVVVFYLVSMYNPSQKRAMTAVFIVSAMNFIIRGYPLWYANFIPLYCIAKCSFELSASGLDAESNPVTVIPNAEESGENIVCPS